MSIKFPIHPAHPERICWGCDQLCATNAMACANERSPHPSELFGDDWLEWGAQQLQPPPLVNHPHQTLKKPQIEPDCQRPVGSPGIKRH